MLKIKAPIELKCNTDVTSVGDAFGEKLRGNYGVMGAGLYPEELMHLVSRPPEIYLGEGGPISRTGRSTRSRSSTTS